MWASLLLMGTFDSKEELITACFPRLSTLLAAVNGEPHVLWKRFAQSGCPAARLDHELFVNTDN